MMFYQIRSILDEISSDMISEWLVLRGIHVLQFPYNHRLSKTEKSIKKRIISLYPLPKGTKKFYFIDANDSKKRYNVSVNKELELTLSCYVISDNRVEIVTKTHEDLICSSLCELVDHTSWAFFLIDKFGNNIWYYNFFKFLDINIIRDYILAANLTTNSVIEILLLMESTYFKVFFFVDENGYENRVHINYKFESNIFRSISRVQDWNTGRKEPPYYTEVLASIDFRTFSKNYYFRCIEQENSL